ncbi:uncharacterized protein T551_01468 [Pneumocystis jirovecii RU7]|uniref:Uncharacterized protein n=1 Tax=Pneumocystis jirovecii (strain RU7) TaxID=1408657 RepID=A0A0W4ZRC5_PNEJ7|nr:uncharacterized protein T551_01468 [Pneumocystis jirovecii RU7]KTW30916.1 hypothetical protein T551_01468 [Pneumocystis jirovecii RU7]
MLFREFKTSLKLIRKQNNMFIRFLYTHEYVLANTSLKQLLNLRIRTLYTCKWSSLRCHRFCFVEKRPFYLIFTSSSKRLFLHPGFRKSIYYDHKNGKSHQNGQNTTIHSKIMFSELKRFVKLLKGETRMLSVAIILLFFGSSVSMSMPYIIGKILDFMVQPFKGTFFGIEPFYFYTGLAVIFLVSGASNFGRSLLLRIISERVISKLRSRLYQNTIRQNIEFFNVNPSGDLISRLSSGRNIFFYFVFDFSLDTTIVAKTLTQNFSDGLKSLITTTAGLTMMTWISVKLTSVMMLILPPIVIGSVFYGRYIKALSKKIQKTLGDLTKVSENLRNIYTIKAFTGETLELRSYNNKIRKVFQLNKKDVQQPCICYILIGLSGNMVVLVILAFGGRMVSNSIITIGDLSSFLLYTAYTGNSMIGLSGFYSEFIKGLGASSRLFELLDKKPSIKSTGIFVTSIKGPIEFKDVCFAYPSRPDIPIFSKLSFTIEQGTNVAICGPSGGVGKSTIASLLLRFYDIDSGKITINNMDIREFNLKQFRKKIGIVPQNPTLFSGTIKENIAYGKPDATLEEIIKTIKKSNSNFIMDFPNGINTHIGNNGIQLSGGQKQRIAIARALIKNPEILILDEATSALDGKSEVLVDEALQNLIQQENLTSITIAHRLATIQRAHKIIVLNQKGKVIEEGTYAELSKNINSAFMRLMRSQMCGYELVETNEIIKKSRVTQ